ncbi:MAG TPA: Minf_1886 family protein [Planctomycetota bacterium]|nr:Minf_1886 family protein [Planctomycetota bacterium]
MRDEQDLETRIRALSRRDPRYDERAYLFVLESLDRTIRSLGRAREEGAARHVSGPELLDGIRRYALDQFGPLSRVAFETWGVRRTQDFGAIVFRLVDAGLLSRQDSDSLDDFAGGFDFVDAFERGYEVPVNEARI